MSVMALEVTNRERELLLELAEWEQKRVIQELDHADIRDYKAILRERLHVLEELLVKVQSPRSV